MGEVLTRTLAGGVFILLIILACVFSYTSAVVLFSVFLYICCAELAQLLGMKEKSIGLFQLIAVLSYYFIVAPIFIPLETYYYVPFALVSGTVMGLIGLRQYDMVFGLVYLTIPLSLLAFMGTPDIQLVEGSWTATESGNAQLILAFFILIWFFDTFAYLSGRFFGKHKMAPSISPGKTWEGFFGGLSFAVLSALALCELFELPIGLTIPLAFIVGVFGTLGDLLESYIKRGAGAKDSGNFIPGHGGLLDRLDSVLIAAPFAISYVYLYNQL